MSDLRSTRDDYDPIDLSPLSNSGLSVFEEEWARYGMRSATLAGDFAAPTPRLPPVGRVTLRGLPFLIGGEEPDPASGRCFALFGPRGYTTPRTIPVDRPAKWLVFAHTLLDTAIPETGAIGEVAAQYEFHLASGASTLVPIRELFEIAIRPRYMGGSLTWLSQSRASWPFVARPDRFDSVFDEPGGPWELAGFRLRDTIKAPTRGYYLWAWRNESGEAVSAVTIRPTHRDVVLAGVTAGYEDEHPLIPLDVETVLLRDSAPGSRAFAVTVDRGMASHPRPVPASTEHDAASISAGRGRPMNGSGAPAYVRIAATPSATVSVLDGGSEVGSVRWRELRGADRPMHLGQGVTIEAVDHDRTWVHTVVVDRATGRAVPCRVHFEGISGIPYQPYGHPQHLGSDLSTNLVDVGGDVRLGMTTYAYIDGTCQGWLPTGKVLIEVVRGFEYRPLREIVEISPDQHQLRVEIERWADMRALGWYSGDPHVHALSASGAHHEARGEDLAVVSLLQVQFGSLFTGSEDWTGRPSVSGDGDTIVYVSQENRQHMLGHLSLLGLSAPVLPWTSDGPAEGEIGAPIETTLAHWADACHAQGGTVVAPHFAGPYGAELAALIATRRVDALEMIQQQPFDHAEYYRFLNAGYRLPLVGGTDKMSGEVPIGQYRTYVRVGTDRPLDYAAWCSALRAGRTFLSAGPILDFEVEGCQIGDTVTIGRRGGTVHVHGSASSADPIHVLQLVANGEVISEASSKDGAGHLELDESVRVERDSWFALRAGGPGYFGGSRTLSSLPVGVFAHTSPIYLAGDGEWRMDDVATLAYMRTLVQGCLEYIDGGATLPGSGRHYEQTGQPRVNLRRPFIEALDALDRRRRTG